MNNFSYMDLIIHLGVSGAHPGGSFLSKKILKKLDLSPKTNVLEVGCGTGETAAIIKELYHPKLTVIDQSAKLLERAKKRFAENHLNIKAIRGNIEKLPFKNHSFDVIFAESVTIFTNREKSLQELRRVLKKGGYLLDIEMINEHHLKREEREELQDFYKINWIPTEQEWLESFKNTGFKAVDILDGGSIFQTIFKNALPNRKITSLSSKVNPELNKIWMKHQKFTIKYAHKLGYRVFKATKL